MQKGVASMGNSMKNPQKIKNDLLYDPGIFFLGIYLKVLKAESWKDIHILNVYHSIFPNIWVTEATQISINKLMIKKMWYTHIQENYTAFKKEEILSQVTTWMTGKHYPKWNIPVTKGQILFDSTYILKRSVSILEDLPIFSFCFV